MRLRTLGHWRLWPHGATEKGRNVSSQFVRAISYTTPSTSPSTICYSLSLWVLPHFCMGLSSSKRSVSPFFCIFGWLRIGKLFRATLQVEFRVPINGLINTYKFPWGEIPPPISGVDFGGGAVVVHRSFSSQKNANFSQVKIWRFENEAPGWSWKRGFNSLISWGSFF